MSKKELKKPAMVHPSISKRGGSRIKSLKLPLDLSKSDESLLNKSTQRKTSTPTHEHNMMSSFPDISCIGNSEATCVLPQKKPLKRKPVPKAPTEEEIQERIDIEYTRYLQAVFKSKLAERKSAEIEDNLKKTQERIKKDEQILCDTIQRLKNINFNQEIDLLHSLHMPNYGKVLENLDESNCEEYLITVNKKIDQSRNQLRMRKVEIPQGGIEQLASVISETSQAFQKLNEEQDNEIPKVLLEIKKVNENTSNELSRAAEKLPKVESLLLTRATMEISQHIPDEYRLDSPI